MSSSDIKVVVDYSDLTGLIKTSKQTEQSLSLVARSFAKTKDQKAYMTGINQIVKAQQNLDAKSRMSRKEIMKLGASMRQEAVFAEQLANATQRAGTAMQQTARKTNQLGVLMQQSGYQVGDFAVQVQSGTNFMVAFGQQATQLVGTFAMLAKSTKMIALFSGLGIIVPILTAIGAALMRTSDSGKSLSETVDDLSSSFDSYITAASGANSSTEDLLKTYGRITPEILELEERLQNLKLRQVALDAQATAKAISGWDFGGAALGGELDDIRVTFDTTSDRARVLQRAIAAIGQAKGPEGTLAAIQALSAQVIDVVGGVDNLTENQIEFLQQVTASEQEFQRLVNILGIVKVAQDDVNDSQEKSYKRFNAHIVAWQKHQDKIAKANTDAQQELALLEQKSVLLQLEKDNTKDSSVYKKMALGYEQDNLRAKLELKGVEEKIIEDILSQLSIQARITQEISDSADEAERLKKVYDEVFKAGSFLFKQRFQGEATVMDQSLTPSGKIGMSYEELLAAGVPHDTIVAMGIKPPKTPKAKGSDLEKLRERLDLEEALIGKTEVQRTLLGSLGVNYEKIYGQEITQKLEARLEAIKRVNEETAKMQGIADTIGNAMSNSLMSIVDGTQSVKEAFKSMASDIIKHLYKVLVVQQMVNAFGGFLSSSSNASVSKIGKALQSYDGGGYTGNGSRSGGLDGKGGFMAMLHPKETVVDHSKGQSGGVTVVQNINISTGVQQTVRAEIRQMMPQIAQSAKAAVVDSKRRGGNYGRAMA